MLTPRHFQPVSQLKFPAATTCARFGTAWRCTHCGKASDCVAVNSSTPASATSVRRVAGCTTRSRRCNVVNFLRRWPNRQTPAQLGSRRPAAVTQVLTVCCAGAAEPLRAPHIAGAPEVTCALRTGTQRIPPAHVRLLCSDPPSCICSWSSLHSGVDSVAGCNEVAILTRRTLFIGRYGKVTPSAPHWQQRRLCHKPYMPVPLADGL